MRSFVSRDPGAQLAQGERTRAVQPEARLEDFRLFAGECGEDRIDVVAQRRLDHPLVLAQDALVLNGVAKWRCFVTCPDRRVQRDGLTAHREKTRGLRGYRLAFAACTPSGPAP